MLQKRIDLGSIPFGLARAGEDIVKGSAVVVRLVGGELKAFYPTTEAEANAVKGFATFRIETNDKSDKDHDVVKAGGWVVIYTLVKNNQWATTQMDGTVAKGDNLVVGFGANDKGKLRRLSAAEVTANRKAQFNAYDVTTAGAGYTDAMVEADVL